MILIPARSISTLFLNCCLSWKEALEKCPVLPGASLHTAYSERCVIFIISSQSVLRTVL